MAEARGVPEGNFPTYRGMDGSIQGSSFRKPRMMGRQVFTYCIGFMMTGDEELLSLARAGTRWLLDHARDEGRGGWFADLDATGAPSGDAAKFAQDASYAVMGPAAYFFVTRDVEAEAAVLETRDLLFTTYWDAAGGRIKDGMDGALAVETYMTAQGSWELVAQLDPHHRLPAPRAAGAERAGATRAGPRRSAHARPSHPRLVLAGRHLLGHDRRHRQLRLAPHRLRPHPQGLLGAAPDRQAPRRPPAARLPRREPRAGARAGPDDDELGAAGPTGRSPPPRSPTAPTGGPTPKPTSSPPRCRCAIRRGSPGWRRRRPSSAPTSSTGRGRRASWCRRSAAAVSGVRNWSNSDTAKANEWKNGFHGAEHALVLYLFSHWLADRPAPLYFALPADRAQALAAESHPYTFLGRVATVEDLRPLAADPSRRVVRITFDQLR
jgi:hypothetical protein